jgi:hypothetical protein
MHVRGLCLCVDCIRRDTEGVDNARAEQRLQARAMVAGCQRKGPTPERLTSSVVRRKR